jgi:hypothetical protein
MGGEESWTRGGESRLFSSVKDTHKSDCRDEGADIVSPGRERDNVNDTPYVLFFHVSGCESCNLHERTQGGHAWSHNHRGKPILLWTTPLKRPENWGDGIRTRLRLASNPNHIVDLRKIPSDPNDFCVRPIAGIALSDDL